MKTTLPALTPDDFEMRWDAEHIFPFVESEDATIMAHGHLDKADFVCIVRQYDDLCDPGFAETHSESDVSHLWAVRIEREGSDDADGWWLSWTGITADTPDAFPLTMIQR